MKKVLVIGCPGIGAQEFGRELSKNTGIPYLDTSEAYRITEEDLAENKHIPFSERVRKMIQKPMWVVASFGDLEVLLEECDTVFFLDYPRQLCGELIKSGPYAKATWGVVVRFHMNKRPEILKLMEKYSEKNIIVLKNEEDKKIFMQKMRRDTLDKKFSTQYLNFYKWIQETYISNDQLEKMQIQHKKIEKYSGVLLMGIFVLLILCALIGVVGLFTPWRKILWIFLPLALVFFVLAWLVADIPFKKEKYLKAAKDIQQADRIFLEGKYPCHLVVAGYHYYLAQQSRYEQAEERIEKLLEIPEFLDYFSENGLAYTEELISQSTLYFSEYFRKFVTEYYGQRLKKMEDYELFYGSNTYMFDNQINAYDNIPIREIQEGDSYSLAEQHHVNWCWGNEESRELFKKYYLDEEVMVGYQKAHNKTANFYAANPEVYVVPSRCSGIFWRIVETVFAEKLARTTEKSE